MRFLLWIPKLFFWVCMVPFAIVFGPVLFTKRRLP
jgi:hypothetical protein